MFQVNIAKSNVKSSICMFTNGLIINNIISNILQSICFNQKQNKNVYLKSSTFLIVQ